LIVTDIEAHAAELQRQQQKKAETAHLSEEDKVGLGKLGGFDSDIYGATNGLRVTMTCPLVQMKMQM